MKQKKANKIYNVFNTPVAIFERPTGKSMAIPDQSLTVSEILKRYARGLPLGGTRVPMYEDDELEGMPDMNHLDLAERQEISERYWDEISTIKNGYDEKRKERLKAAAEAKAQKDMEAARDKFRREIEKEKDTKG